MNHESYLEDVGLSEFAGRGPEAVERGVSLVARPPHATAELETVEDLYVYPVPEPGEGATGDRLADAPYNLAPVCGLEYDPERLRDHPNTARLVALDETVRRLAEETNPDWVGVSRRATNPDGEAVLVKEAYVGAHSRAEFPLTDSFAERSPAVSVARTGEAVLVDDVGEHDGSSYESDARVRSELCCPVVADGDVVGVVNTKAHEPGFFTPERVLVVAGVCAGLADSDLLTPPRVEA